MTIGPQGRLSAKELMLSNCGAGEDSWESHELPGDQASQSYRKSTLNICWKDCCWSSNTLATWCEEATLWKRPWCWERMKEKKRNWQRIRGLANVNVTNSMDMNLSSFREVVKEREALCAVVHKDRSSWIWFTDGTTACLFIISNRLQTYCYFFK